MRQRLESNGRYVFERQTKFQVVLIGLGPITRY
jgi:hypothetical protein